MRVCDLAKELKTTSKELLSMLKEHHCNVKAAQSNLTPELERYLRAEIQRRGGEVLFQHRLTGICQEDGRIRAARIRRARSARAHRALRRDGRPRADVQPGRDRALAF